MSVWQKGKEAVTLVYQICDTLPKHEQFALGSQMRSAVISIPANIAEGFGRLHTKDKINFYVYSRGSSYELRSHLECGIAVSYFEESRIAHISQLCLEIEKELNFLIQSLR
jgi:four helix bundle protein